MADLTIDPASSSAASTSYPCYDVFLNHRGPDVKHTIASRLYRRLLGHGLRVFLDKDELEPGNPISSQIDAAIRVASVQVAIFSQTYAESEWCLNELLLMIKSGATILPVFYHVQPSELRRTKGAYGDTLQNLQKKTRRDPQTGEEKPRYDADTIRSWKNALSHVADISGIVLDGGEVWDELDFLEKIVQEVLKKVRKTPLYVATYPTGLAEKLEDFERTVLAEEKVKTAGAKVVGIVGVGGVGKTTLAKQFFNLKRSQYSASSFLFDVRENGRTMTLLAYLQCKLILDLKPNLKQLDIRFESPDQGIGELKKHLLSCHALIILDNVDARDQMEAFLPIKDILSTDSLILVTSRDKHVLRSSGVLDSSIYNLKGLNTPDSEELFCCYAFSQRHPLPGFANLVDRFVRECGGLPLSLKVFGALVCRQKESYWEEILDRLHERLPTEIQKRLSISYESLDKEDQSIFLDIVCFFIGEELDTAIRIWGVVGLENLENKCLLEVDSKNKIKMHDHIRDMGRSIAKGGSMPRRLFQIDEFLEQSSSGIIEVRGISMVGRVEYSPLSPESVWHSEMSLYKRWRHEFLANHKLKLFNNDRCHGRNLKILSTEDGYLEAILRRVRSPELIWLRWYRCPYNSLPSWVPMNNLRVLEVFGSRLKMLWPSETQAPLDLRELNIFAPISHFPKSMGQLQHLEKIVVDCDPDAVVALKTLPEEFCDLCSLKYLVLKSCTRLMSLPESFGKLTNLQHINLTSASTLETLPNSFGNLTRLKHLDLSDCYGLKISNGTLGNITTLEYLNLSRCMNVNKFLPQVALQPHLKTLHLLGTGLEELPSTVGDLSNLEEFSLESNMLEEFPPSFFNLRSLEKLLVEYCWKLKCLPDAFGLLTQLTELRFRDCEMEYLPEVLLSLKNLQILGVWNCPLRELPFKKLQAEIKAGGMLNKLDSKYKCMFGLRRLVLIGINISEVAFPEGVCPNLQCLSLQGCKEMRQIGELCGLAKLQELQIFDCKNIQELSSLETLMSLAKLVVSCCPKLKSIQGLAQLTKLRELTITSCPELLELPSVEQVMSLESLYVVDCSKVKWGEAVLEQLRQRVEFFTVKKKESFIIRLIDNHVFDICEENPRYFLSFYSGIAVDKDGFEVLRGLPKGSKFYPL